MREIFTDSGDPENESFEITRIETPFLFVSPNGNHFSNLYPIDNKGNLIYPKGSKYHK